ncbi:LANO_0H16732g1_1 [Lachancea nothofagi CBS 11611]|uniref:Nuclear distribution protein PAC1 n=1 Tax=Lachancea nothofagi CBS 11611 TaxID=1266666 RepID=A0A1G4KMT6_9SACH|nr:LANO_0H16732g1_1 [Lachancea nothofagi CBS 11611]
MSLLPSDQRQLLHKCILNYVQNQIPQEKQETTLNEGADGSDHVISTLAHWLKVDLDTADTDRPVDGSLLPRKWSSIVRLQRRIIELEKQIEGLTEENEVLMENGPASGATKSSLKWIPRERSNFSINCGASVTSAKLHPELPLLFVATDAGKLQCYDLMNYSMPVASVQAHMRGIVSIDVQLSDSSECLIVTASKDLYCKAFRLVDSQLQLIRTFSGHEHVVSQIKVWKRGTDTLAATCSRDLSCRIWDVSNGWCLKSFQPHTEWVRCLDILGEYIVTGSNDCTVRLSHWPTGRGLSFGMGHNFPVEKVKIIPMQKSAEAADDQQNKYNLFNEEYAELGFSHVISTSRDNTIRIWQVPLPRFVAHRPPQPNSSRQHFELITTLSGHSSWVRDICVRGDYLLSCSDDRSIRVWDLTTGHIVRVIGNAHDGFVNCIDTDQNGLNRQLLISGGTDGKLKVFIK